jgi:hypothetical protein
VKLQKEINIQPPVAMALKEFDCNKIGQMPRKQTAEWK